MPARSSPTPDIARVAFTNVNPGSAANVTAALFDHSLHSAFVVASVTSCGGCDNSPTANANIAAQSAAIASFFDTGDGIIGLAGAGDPSAYAYVPETATNAGGNPPSSSYIQTAAGAALGIPAVNGDTAHNFFNEPGPGGLSSLYQVVERLGDPVTVPPSRSRWVEERLSAPARSRHYVSRGQSVGC